MQRPHENTDLIKRTIIVDRNGGVMSNSDIKAWLRQHGKRRAWLAKTLDTDDMAVLEWLNGGEVMPRYLRKHLWLILENQLLIEEEKRLKRTRKNK